MSGSPSLATSVSPLDLEAYRRDLWPRQTLATMRGSPPPAPARVAWPRDGEEVRAALSLAAAEGLSVVPYGAGSGVCGGAAGREGSLVVDLKRMDAIEDLDVHARTVRVQPGVLGQHLEDWLARRGWMTAHSPSSIWCSTVGGYVAARSAGQFSSRYGVFEDMLLAASAEAPAGHIDAGAWTPDGEEDLLPVLCGSEGGLAIVTDTLLRIAPLPDTRWQRGYAFDNLQSAWTAMRRIMQAGLWPSVLRLYDPQDTRLNRTTSRRPSQEPRGPGVVAQLRDALEAVPALRHQLAAVPLALPGLINRVAAGLGREVALIVGFEGGQRLVDAQVALARRILGGARDLGSTPGERWFAHRHAVSYKQAPIFVAGGFADTMEVAATWSRLPELHRAVRAAIGRHAVVMAHFSHAYPEGCSIYFSFAGRGRLDVYDAVWRDALAAVRVAGGTVTHHHGVGQLKSAAAARELGAAIDTWRDLKQRWDPDGRMNPGRPLPTDPVEPLPGDTETPPEGEGPIFELDELSLLATVDPRAAPKELDAALAERGFGLRLRPDRPLYRWLPALRRTALDAWEAPFFGAWFRLEDGRSVHLGVAPRSAAGPDLRQALMRRATLVAVQLPVRRLDADDVVIRVPAEAGDARDVRPTWRKDDRWGFSADLEQVAVTVGGSGARGTSPRRHPQRAEPALPTSPSP